jgi:hypothetical protein
MPKTCPACGSRKESGKFCSQCGGTLEQSLKCSGCGNTIPPGGRFCNMCGIPVAGTPAAAGPAGDQSPGLNPNLPWFIAGAALIALAAAIVAPRFTSSEPETVAAPPITGPAVAGANPPDLSTMTPEEAAGNLYNRVMRTLSAGDTAQAMMFVPMAISAYGMVDQLDSDGLYHLAVLQLVNSDPAAARQTAEQILSREPNHLFGLITAAQAESLMGSPEEAGDLYSRFLEHYEAEIAAGRPEYTEHEPVLAGMRAEAERFAGLP